jgi:hypothetical protein
MRNKYIIQDWAGNRVFQNEEFRSYEDAWEYLYNQFRHLNDSDFEDQLGEFYVEFVGSN